MDVARQEGAAPVIPIGPNVMSPTIDPARVAMERARARGEGARRADAVVGFFGVLYASKRPDLLLRTVAALHARGVKAGLLVCGDFLWDKPNDRAAFLDLAAALGLADWLDFRGAASTTRASSVDAVGVGRLPVALFGRRQRAARQFPGGEPARHSVGHHRTRSGRTSSISFQRSERRSAVRRRR